MKDQLIRDGFTHQGTRPFAFPVYAWSLDLEVQSVVELTAAERTVLRLAGEGLRTVAAIAQAMGFGADTRLVATTATNLLEAAGLASDGAGLVLTPVGQGMLATSRLARRERTSGTAYFRPIDRSWSWQRPPWITEHLDQTIELAVEPPTPRQVPDEIRRLVSAHGVPGLDDRAVKGEAAPVELLGLRELSGTPVFERIEIEMWRHPVSKQPAFLGVRDGEFDEHLTRMFDGASYKASRGRLVLSGG